MKLKPTKHIVVNYNFTFFNVTICSLEAAKLVLGQVKEHSLTFSQPLSVVQGSYSTFPFPFLLNQLALELLNTFFDHVEGIHGRYSSPLFFLHLSIGIIHHLLGPKCGLDGLESKKSIIKKKKKDLPWPGPFSNRGRPHVAS